MFKKNIPNTITLLNLFCGCIAIITAVEQQFAITFMLVCLALVFDFLDGMMARLLKAYSPLGKELDSLADLVSFGVVPAMVVYFLGLQYMGFLIALFSALRLAKFNIDERQTTSFVGLPTPANAIFFVSIGYIVSNMQHTQLALYFSNPTVLSFFTLLFSYLLVAEIPMFSLKFKNLSFKDNKVQFIFILVSLVALVLYQVLAIPFIIVLYISTSIVKNFICR